MSYPSEKVRIVAPYPYTYRFRIKQAEAGKTVSELLYERFPFRPATEWENRIASGRITLNNLPTSANTLVKEYDVISHFNPAVVEPSVPDNVNVIQETDDYIVVFKPAPMPVHSGGRYFKNALTYILAGYGYKNLHITHRLDAVTSGLVLFGKTKAFAKKAQLWFSSNTAVKKYVALVSGMPKTDEFSCSLPISRDRGYRFKCGLSPDSKHALTRFHVLKRYNHHALIHCFPETGRTHQIRLHLQACGFPVANDPVYGPEPERTEYQNRAIFLMHACFQVPGEDIFCEIPMPHSWLTEIEERESADS